MRFATAWRVLPALFATQVALVAQVCNAQPEIQDLGNQTGSVRLLSTAPEVAGALTFAIEGAESGRHGCLLVSAASRPVTYPAYGITLVPDDLLGSVIPYVSDAGGNAMPLFCGELPAGLCGLQAYVQSIIIDTRLPSGMAATNAVRLRQGRDPVAPALSVPVALPIELGGRATIALSATDVDGRRLPLVLEPQPLPRNASFDATSGEFAFMPDELQAGVHTLTARAVGRFGTATRTFRIAVSPRDPTGATEMSGTVRDSATANPLSGVRIRVPGTSLNVATAADGTFRIGPVPIAARIIEIDGAPIGWTYVAEEISLLLDHALIGGQNNVISRPIYLPALGPPSGQVNPATRSTLNNGAGVEVVVEPQSARGANGTLYSGPMYMPQVARERTPAALPDTLAPAMVVAIQPAGLTFNPPAPITLPNANNLPTGTEVNIWSIDPESGEFHVVATGTVDGAVIRSNPGQGIRNSSWHFAEPGGPDGSDDTGDNPGPNDDPNRCSDPGSSAVSLQSGNLTEEHHLATYSSLGRQRGLRLVYNSRAATARSVISTDLSLHRRFATPVAYEATVELGGVALPERLFFEAASAQDRSAQRIAMPLDGASLPTGFYPYRMRISSHYPQSRVSTDVVGGVVLQNLRSSACGCGWSLGGIQRLTEQADERVVIDTGDGAVLAFRRGVRPSPGLLLQMYRLQTFGELNQGYLNRQPGVFQVTDAFSSEVTDSLVVPGVNFPDTAFDTSAFFSVGENGVVEPASGPTTPFGDDLSIQPPGGNDLFGASFSGYLRVPQGGSVTFRIGVDDGFVFYLAGKRVFAQLNPTDFQYFTFSVPNVPAGNVAIRLDFAENGGEAGIVLEASGGGLPGGVVPRAFLATAISSGAETEYISPPGDFSVLVKTATGTFERRMPDGTRFLFSTSGQLETEVDRSGNVTTYTYDGTGCLTMVRDPAGQETHLSYSGGLLQRVDHPGLASPTLISHLGTDLVGIQDPDGGRRFFVYDASHRLVGQRDKRGFDTAYQYGPGDAVVQTLHIPTGTARAYSVAKVAALVANPASTSLQSPARLVRSAGIATRRTDRRGGVTEVVLHRSGHPARMVDPLGNVTSWVRDDHGLPAQTTAANGRVDVSFYDARGNLTRFEEAVGTALHRITTFAYHASLDRVIRTTNAEGRVTDYEYNATGDLTRVSNPDGTQRTFTYDARGLVLSSTDENGNRTTYSYDSLGQVESVTNALGEVTRYTRDSRANVLSIVEGFGRSEQRTRTFSYDAKNRVLSATDGAGGVTSFTYDAEGNLLTTALPTGESIVRTYDSMGRLQSLSDPLRGVTTFGYDAEGNLLRRTDARGLVTRFTYDNASRLLTVTDPAGGVESYGYDSSGNVTAFTNARQKTTGFEFDLLDRRIGMTTPNGRVRGWGYDRIDNLTRETQPTNVNILHGYNSRGWRTSTSVPAVVQPDGGVVPGNSIAFTYDAVGNLRTVTDDDTRVERTYDALNRVREERTLAGGIQPVTTLTSAYNAVGDRASLADSLGGLHTYGHDGAGRLTSVNTPEIGTIALSYDTSGRLRTVSNPNGVTGTYSYLANGRLSQITHARATGPPLVSLSYATGPSGNIDGIDDAGVQRSYGYDAADRLTAASDIAPAAYAYDAVGNRTRSDSTNSAVHNDDNQLLSDDTGTYLYDLRGNLASFDSVGATPPQVYRWDGQNQLVEAVGVSSYRYDGLGRRIEKVTPSRTRRYVYNGGEILLEFDGSGVFLARYSHGEQVDQHLAMERGGAPLFYHTDHLGSVRSVTDGAGSEVNRYRYDPYGRVVERLEAVESPYWYTGREEASEIGWHYYRARWYAAQSGRFAGEDQLLFAGGVYETVFAMFTSSFPPQLGATLTANYYAYVSSNPLIHTDPEGFGKVKILLELVSGARRYMETTLETAANMLRNGKNVDFLPPNANRNARQAAERAWGDIKKDPPHGGASKRPHYQPADRNGRRGHANVRNRCILPLTGLGGTLFGEESFAGEVVDFFNPLQDVQDVINLVQGEDDS